MKKYLKETHTEFFLWKAAMYHTFQVELRNILRFLYHFDFFRRKKKYKFTGFSVVLLPLLSPRGQWRTEKNGGNGL